MADPQRSMHAADWAIVFATFMGPVLAVQAQKWIERANHRRNSKRAIFTTLMQTRATRLHPDHIRALNAIQLAFYGSTAFGKRWQSTKEEAVTDAWKAYHDSLLEQYPPENQAAKTAEWDGMFLDLITAMANDLDYHFDRVTLSKGAYQPRGHFNIETNQVRVLSAAVEVLEGRKAIKIAPLTQQPDPAAQEQPPQAGNTEIDHPR